MKKKHINIAIFGFGFVFLCLLPLWWIDITDFDKYRFTEEYYKFIVYSIQLVCFGAGFSLMLNMVIERNKNEKKQKQITSYLRKQTNYIQTIQNCFKTKTKDGLAEALRCFKITSILLGEIDSNEKVQLEKLDYWDKVKDEIRHILDNIDDQELSTMEQAQSTINTFLDKYLTNRENA
ncbi:hypothetical protein FACS189420_2750 [Bacteroidia bacterium]|nr:hypothetical protein FACS18947_2780 [Bacteroidia bacterium]GHU64868.1 hypothetical protein FACS1894123_10250 [Bacteroidia bacterium]GHV70673.1 hypothetical protein FACS189420_2750 [Bacteroidia bacterium]